MLSWILTRVREANN